MPLEPDAQQLAELNLVLGKRAKLRSCLICGKKYILPRNEKFNRKTCSKQCALEARTRLEAS